MDYVLLPPSFDATMLPGCIYRFLLGAQGMDAEAFEMVDSFIAPTRFLRNRTLNGACRKARFTSSDGQNKLKDFDKTIREIAWRAGFVTGSHSSAKCWTTRASMYCWRPLIFLSTVASPISISISMAEISSMQPKPYRDRITTLTAQLKEKKFENVRWRGRYDHAQLQFLMNRVDWALVPSVWWEICGPVYPRPGCLASRYSPAISVGCRNA